MRRRSKRQARRADMYSLPGWQEYLQSGNYVPLFFQILDYVPRRTDPRDYIKQHAAEAAEHLGIEYAQQT